MGGIRQNVAVLATALSAFAGTALAHEPFGPGTGLASFAQIELAGLAPAIVGAHDREDLAPSAGESNGQLLAHRPVRDAVALSLRYALTPWMSLDFAHGWVRARAADGSPMELAPRVFEQAGATLYPARHWTASLFVNYFRMDSTTQDQGVRGSSASFVNARVNHDLSRRARLSLDVLNVFDKRVAGVDALTSPRLWREPLIAENVLFDASESRGFRLRLRVSF
jgi:hypothetical protein